MLLCYVHGLDISLYVFRSSHECKLFRKFTKWSGAAFGGLAHYGGVAVFLVTSFFRNWDILLRCKLIFIYLKLSEETTEVDLYVVLLLGFGKSLFNLNFALSDSYLLGSPIAAHMKSVNDIMPMIGARFYTQLDAAQVKCDVLEGELAKVII